MTIYRLVHTAFADMEPIGVAGRWNKEKSYVIYASQAISLCCLEILAHIEVFPEKLSYTLLEYEISEKMVFMPELKSNWDKNEQYTQSVGSNWYNQNQSFVMKVPSVIVQSEFNFVINSRHPNYRKLIDKRESKLFSFDKRLLKQDT